MRRNHFKIVCIGVLVASLSGWSLEAEQVATPPPSADEAGVEWQRGQVVDFRITATLTKPGPGQSVGLICVSDKAGEYKGRLLLETSQVAAFFVGKNTAPLALPLQTWPEKPVRCTLLKKGSKLYVYLGGVGGKNFQGAFDVPKSEAMKVGLIDTDHLLSDVEFQKMEDLVWNDDFQRRDKDDPGEWLPKNGHWFLNWQRDVNRSANPFRLAVREEKGEAVSLLERRGSPWGLVAGGYHFGVSFRAADERGDRLKISLFPQPASAAGLLFGYQDENHYFRLRWMGIEAKENPGELMLEKSWDGTLTVLAKRSLNRDDRNWHRLEIEVDGDQVRVFVTDAEVFSVRDADIGPGFLGLYAAATQGTFFDDAMTRNIRACRQAEDPQKPVELYNQVFETEQLMDNWASIWSSWEPRPRPGEMDIKQYTGSIAGKIKTAASLQEQVREIRRAARICRTLEEEDKALQLLQRLTTLDRQTAPRIEMTAEPETPIFPTDKDLANGLSWWHQGDFFGDVTLENRFYLRPGSTFAEANLVLGADDDLNENGGYRLLCWRQGETGPMSLLFLRRLETLGEGTVELKSEADGKIAGFTLALSRKGKTITALVDGEEKFRLEEPADVLSGTRMGLWADGMSYNLHDVKIYTNNVYDEMFVTAPTLWDLQCGDWSIVNRWACDPRWSWLGCRDTRLASLWSRRRFDGDVTVEFFGAFQFRFDWEGRGQYYHKGDLNLTLCGDGKNLDSGYSFIYQGWDNSYTRILRQDQVVAGTQRFKIVGNIHRRWFHVKVTKRGPKISMYIDGVLAREYEDPTPLTGGKIAFWSYDNGVMIARLRISSAGMRSPELPEPMAAAEPVLPTGEPTPLKAGEILHDDFETSQGEWLSRGGEQGPLVRRVLDNPAEGKCCLAVTEAFGGGDFSARITKKPFDLNANGRLAFDLRITKETRVNLYLLVNEVYYTLLLTGDDEGWQIQPVCLGRVPLKADGKWEHLEIDLKTLLKKVAPQEEKYLVTDLAIGNLSNRDYLQAGFNGNRAGATYYIDNFRIFAADKTPATTTVLPEFGY